MNRKFYYRKAIEKTATAFSHLCTATIVDDFYTVRLDSPTKIDPVVTREFLNYCLGLVKQDGN